MERIVKWILQLEEELDKQDNIVSNDLKSIKEQFQNHEVIKTRIFYVLRFDFLLGIYDRSNTRSKSNR
jgi:site-specific recombinase XerC